MTATLDVGATEINPVAKLLAALTLAVGLVLSVDWVSASTALILELILLAVLRVRLRALLHRGAILLVAAGRGLALAPASAIHLGVAGVVHKELRFAAGPAARPVELHAIWPRGAASPLLRRALDLLAALADDPG